MRPFLLFLAVLIATSVPASAAPVAGAIAAISSWTVAGIAVGQMIIGFAINLGLSLLARALGDKPEQGSGGIRSEAATAGEATSQSVIIGKYATAGNNSAPPYTSGKSGDTQNAYLTYVRDLADAPITSLDGVWIDDEHVPLLAPDPGSEYPDHLRAGGRYEGRAWFKFFDGTQTEAYSSLLGFNSGERPWGLDMIGRGIPYVVCRFKLDEELYPGMPDVLFEVTGTRLYDPRKDDTVGGTGAHRWGQPGTYEPSENPAVQIYNILRGIALEDGSTWGGGVPSEDLPLNNWFAAMNEADVVVDGQPQYRSGFEIRVGPEEFGGDLPADVIDEINRGSAGQISEFGGIYKIRIGGPGLPVMAFTDDDVIISEDQEFIPYPGLESSYNGIQAQYPEPQERWVSKEAPPRYNQTYEAQDQGRRLIASIVLPTVIYSDQVQRIMRSYIEEERRFRRHDLSLPPDFAALEPLDSVAWTSEVNGYSAKVFEVTGHAHNLQTLVDRFGLRERDPSDYDWEPGYRLPTTIVPVTTAPPPPRTVINFSVHPYTVVDADGGARLPAIRMIWLADQPDARGLRYEVRPLSQTALAAQGSTQDVEVGALVVSAGLSANMTYEVRARMTIPGLATVWTPWLQVTTPDARMTVADLADEVIDEMEATAELAGIKTVTELPPTGDKPDQIVMLVPDGILYRWDAGAGEWVTEIYAGIPDGYLDATKFAQGIEPVTVIADTDPLPTVKSTETVFWRGKLYRWNGSEYVASVPVQDIDGAIPPSKLAVIPGMNLFPDPQLQDEAFWFPTIMPQNKAFWAWSPGKWTALAATGVTFAASGAIAIQEGYRYRAKVKMKRTTGTMGRSRMYLRYYDANMVWVANHSAPYDNLSTLGTSYTSLVESTVPAAARFVLFLLQVDHNLTDGEIEFTEPEMNLLAGSDLIDDAAITAQKIADNAITAIKLASDSVTRDKILAGAVSELELANAAVTAAKVATGAITDVKIATNAITQTKISDGAISTPKLAANAVTAAKIAANTITANEIAANAVTAVELAAGSVQAGHIVAGAVQTDKLAANAVTAAKIAANTITAAEISAGAIGAEQIAAGSIIASKLAVMDFTNLVPDNQVQDATSWSIGDGWSIVPVASASWDGNKLFRYVTPSGATGNGGWLVSAPFKVAKDLEYFCQLQASGSGLGSSGLDARISWHDASGTVIAAPAFISGSVNGSTGQYYSGSLIAPAGAVTARVRIYVTAVEALTGSLNIGSLLVREKNNAQLIVDGAITASKIGANQINAGHISADSVGASEIIANSITGNHIAANSITATEVAANAITASELAANSVSAGHIQANAITAGKIAAGAVSAAQIAAGAIIASKIAISDFTNLVPDFDMTDVESWIIPAAWTRANSGANFRGAYWVYTDFVPGANSPVVRSSKFVVEVNKSYFFDLQVRGSAAGDDLRANYRVDWFDRADTLLSSDNVAGGTVVTGTSIYALSNTFTAPAGACFARMNFFLGVGSVSGRIYVGGWMVRRVNGGELIVDGAITTNKISAGAVTTNSIAAGAIVASRIASGAVTADKVAANTITSVQINVAELVGSNAFLNNLEVGSAQIANAAIESAHIKNLSVDTIKIANGAVTGQWSNHTSGEGNVTLTFPTIGGSNVIIWGFAQNSATQAAPIYLKVNGVMRRGALANSTITYVIGGNGNNMTAEIYSDYNHDIAEATIVVSEFKK